MTHPDNNFKDKLYDLETPLGDSVSFEKVMAMRQSRPALGWWKPTVLVVATLSVVSLAGYFLGNGLGTRVGSTQASSAQNKQTPRQSPNGGPQQTEKIASSHSNQPISSNPNGVTQNTTSGDEGTRHNEGFNDHFGENPITPDEVTPVQSDMPAKDNEVTTSEADKNWDELFGGLHRKGIKAVEFEYPFVLGNKVSAEGKESVFPPVNPWSLELTVVTGGHNYKNYLDNKDYSIRGTNHYGQYNLSALYNLQRGWQLAAGVGYTENYGNGEWRKIENRTMLLTDSHKVKIVQPGLPDQYKTVYDTTKVNTKVASNGNLNYHLVKLSLPIGFRYNFGSGRMALRVSGIVAPGMLVANSGNMFNRQNSFALGENTNRTATLDFRMAFGAYLPVGRRLGFLAEPIFQYQSVLSNKWNGYNKLSAGLSMGLVYKL